MEFWEYEAGLSPVQAGYVPTPTQAAYLAAPPVPYRPPVTPDRPPQAGEELGGSMLGRFLGTDPVIDPTTGMPVDVAMGGVSPLALLGPALRFGVPLLSAAAAGAMLPVGPGGAISPIPAFGGNGGGVLPGAPVPTVVNGVPISGPGVPEPPGYMISRHWKVKVESQKYGTFQMYYWSLTDGRQMSYHSPTKTWKIWKPKKHIVISSNPRVKMLAKLNRLNKRVEKMLKPYQPKKPRTQIVPARALSSIERAALKG